MTKPKLIARLRALGSNGWGSKDPHSYFSHSGGRVSLGAASRFFREAVALTKEAADALAAYEPSAAEAELNPITRAARELREADKSKGGLNDEN